MKQQSPDDIIRWPDGTECYRHELHEMSYMSDDYEVIPAADQSPDLVAPCATKTWVVCGECDVSFSCHEGAGRRIRL